MGAIGYAALVTALAEAALALGGPLRIAGALSAADIPYLGLLALFALSGASWILTARRREPAGGAALAETLISATLVLYLFALIYAANANMDYVQRFAASSGNVRLAPDTRTHRLAATARCLPLLSVAVAAWVRFRVIPTRAPLVRWALPAALLSSVLMSLAFPSFLVPRGLGPLAFVAYVPLFTVLAVLPPARAVFHGGLAWVVQTMITSYWLGTFSLISLQVVTVLLGLEGLALFAVAVPVHRWVGKPFPGLSFLVWPLAWTVFDWLRSVGFLGYPWGLVGATQYAWVSVIQVAAVAGVWGVGLIVLLPASAVSALLVSPRPPGGRAAVGLGASLGILVLAAGGGAVLLAIPRPTPASTVRLALIQQNDDPRKSDYEATFRTLRRLTDLALAETPDLVVWSEAAFVPNIRRWSAVDPAEHPYADLVHRFLVYQRETATWLLTGNDDYLLERSGEDEVRTDYNATILFSPSGERVRTYHKIRLVPFTESFPWKDALPGLHKLLLSFDVYLWEPGSERVVFEHPRFRFATPICFEDAFPDHVRRFVRVGGADAGLDVILNVSNDYWSLTEVEARQHAANAVFRAVENRRPVIRGTASGLTTYIDPWGRRRAELPPYTEDALVVDVALGGRPTTPYTRWGDWLPPVCALALSALALGALVGRNPRGGGGRGGARPASPVQRLGGGKAKG